MYLPYSISLTSEIWGCYQTQQDKIMCIVIRQGGWVGLNNHFMSCPPPLRRKLCHGSSSYLNFLSTFLSEFLWWLLVGTYSIDTLWNCKHILNLWNTGANIKFSSVQNSFMLWKVGVSMTLRAPNSTLCIGD